MSTAPTPESIDPSISTAELRRLYSQFGPPFTTTTPTSQVELFVRVGHMLHERRPTEADHGGERIALTDISQRLAKAERFLAIRGVTACRPPVRGGDLNCF